VGMPLAEPFGPSGNPEVNLIDLFDILLFRITFEVDLMGRLAY